MNRADRRREREEVRPGRVAPSDEDSTEDHATTYKKGGYSRKVSLYAPALDRSRDSHRRSELAGAGPRDQCRMVYRVTTKSDPTTRWQISRRRRIGPDLKWEILL
jgi:hypothetical protein